MSKSKIIKLNIKFTPKQQEVEDANKRFNLLEWGRRVGKTLYEAYFLAKNAILKPGKHWYVTRTLALGREELWPALMDLLPRDLVSKTDERLLNVRLTNGSIISLKSGEKEDNLRGRGLQSAVLDEAAFLKERLWPAIIRPQLAISRGPAVIASSSKKGWFTRLCREQVRTKDPDWFYSHATIYDNPYMHPEEIEQIKAKTPLNTWLQEYMAQEITDEGQVYEEFSPKNIYDPGQHFLDVRSYKTVLGIDWGLADPTGVAWVSVSPEGYIVISEEHEQKGWDVSKHSAVIQTKSQGFNVVDRVLDRTAFRKEGTSMVSIWDQFRDQGIYCQPSEKDLTASIDKVKRFIRGDGDKPWLYISSKCAKLIEAMQSWENGDHEPDICAAMRYAVVHAVVHRITRLSDLVIAGTKTPIHPVSQATADLIFATHARIVPTHSRKQWQWDLAAGVPY